MPNRKEELFISTLKKVGITKFRELVNDAVLATLNDIGIPKTLAENIIIKGYFWNLFFGTYESPINDLKFIFDGSFSIEHDLYNLGISMNVQGGIDIDSPSGIRLGYDGATKITLGEFLNGDGILYNIQLLYASFNNTPLIDVGNAVNPKDAVNLITMQDAIAAATAGGTATGAGLVGDFDASSGDLPTTGNGDEGVILKGDSWKISVAGSFASGVSPTSDVTLGDVLYAKVNAASDPEDFFVIQGNLTKANQTQAEGLSENEAFMTSLRTRQQFRILISDALLAILQGTQQAFTTALKTKVNAAIDAVSNGLSKSGTTVRLGGDLTTSTELNLLGKLLGFKSQNSSLEFVSNTWKLSDSDPISGDIFKTLTLPSGKILVSGAAQLDSGNHFFRLNTDGSLDGTFTNDAPNDTVSDFALQSDGKIIIVGRFTTVEGNVAKHMARLNSDGSYDNTFTSTTEGFDDNSPLHLLIQDDDKIIVVGGFQTYGSTSALKYIRLNTDGTIDIAWLANADADSTNSDFPSNGIVKLSDDKVIIAGQFHNTYGATTYQKMIRLNTDGTPDDTYLGTSDADIHDIALQSDEKLIMLTNTGDLIVRLNTDGTVDTTFADNLGDGFTGDWIDQILIQSDDKILVVGDFTEFDEHPVNSFCRLNADGTFDDTFQYPLGETSNVNYFRKPLSLYGEDKLIWAGDIYNGVDIGGIIKLTKDGALDTGEYLKLRTLPAGYDGPRSLNDYDFVYKKWVEKYIASSPGSGSVAIVNDFSSDPDDPTKAAGADAVYALYQLLTSDDISYDTLQEVVNFIKTIDTTGELVAAIDAAVGDTNWRMVEGSSRPVKFPIDLSESGTINCALGQRLYYTLTADEEITEITNLDEPTIIDLSGDFTAVFSDALLADSNNVFFGAESPPNSPYILLTPREAGGFIVEYVTAPIIVEDLKFALSGIDADLEASTTVRKMWFRPKVDIDITKFIGDLEVGGTGTDLVTFDVHVEGTTIFSTKPTIDTSDTSTLTAATPQVISDGTAVAGSLVEIFIDQVGNSTPGTSAQATIEYRKT